MAAWEGGQQRNLRSVKIRIWGSQSWQMQRTQQKGAVYDSRRGSFCDR